MSLFVYALGTASVVPLVPANASWTNLSTNFTVTFRWSDVNDADIHLADCKLYLNYSEAGLYTSPNEYGRNASSFANITNSSTLNTTIFFNRTIGERGELNNTALYWGVKCTNLSSSPTTGQIDFPRLIYQDLLIPEVAEVSKNFSNNTWITTDIMIEINVSDNGTTEGMHGDSITCEIVNGSTVIATATTGETTLNGTNVTVISSGLTDGFYNDITFRCRDPAGNINTSNTIYNLSIDTTNPATPSFNDPTPDDEDNQTANLIIFNVTVFDINLNSVILEFDGVNQTMNLTNSDACNATAPYTAPIYCNVTNVSVADKRDYALKVYVNDSAGNVVTAARTFSVSNNSPTIDSEGALPNWTISRSLLSYRFKVTTTTPLTCRAIITDRHGVLVNTTIYGAVIGNFSDISPTTANCTGTINTSNFNTEGAFTVKYNYTNAVGNSNQSATGRGGVLTRLFAGWNIITYPDGNKSALEVCEEIDECSKVSWFNNSGKSFITFSNSTLSVNNGTDIPTGEAIYVYLNSNSWIMTNDHLDITIELETVWNFSLTTPGWNLVGLLTNTSMNTTMHVQGVNSTTVPANVLGANNTYSSYLNASASTFYSCKRTLNKCSGTSVLPKNIELLKGYGIWMLTPANVLIWQFYFCQIKKHI